MLVTLWIIDIVFGLIGLALLRKFFVDKLGIPEAILMVFSILMFALAAGMLFDGVGTFGGVVDVGQ